MATNPVNFTAILQSQRFIVLGAIIIIIIVIIWLSVSNRQLFLSQHLEADMNNYLMSTSITYWSSTNKYAETKPTMKTLQNLHC